MPSANGIVAVLIATTRPCRSTSGPPLFPGFTAASVWMTGSPSPGQRVRFLRRELTTPDVTVGPPGSPSGLPIARTGWPTLSSSEFAKSAGRKSFPSTRTTATSVSSSPPTTVPLRTRPSLNATITLSAPSITWCVVRMSPLSSRITPDPIPRRGHGPNGGPYGPRAVLTLTVLSPARSTAPMYAFCRSANMGLSSPRRRMLSGFRVAWSHVPRAAEHMPVEAPGRDVERDEERVEPDADRRAHERTHDGDGAHGWRNHDTTLRRPDQGVRGRRRDEPPSRGGVPPVQVAGAADEDEDEPVDLDRHRCRPIPAHQRRGEGHERDEHEEEDVGPQEAAVRVVNHPELRVMRDPVDAEDHEADRIDEEARQETDEFAGEDPGR